MKIIAKSGIDYVPEFNGNRKEAKESQIVVSWNYLSGIEKESVMGLAPIMLDSSGEVKNEFSFRFDNKGLLEKSIKSIKNLMIQEGEKERQATSEDICNMPELAGLYRELVDFLMEQNRNEGKKK